MSSIKPEERTKVIVLVSAISLVFLVGGVNAAKQMGIGASSPAPSSTAAAGGPAGPEATPPAVPSTVLASTGTGAPSLIPPAVSVPSAKMAVMTPYTEADPFRPAVPEVTPVTPVATPVPSALSAPGIGAVTIKSIPTPYSNGVLQVREQGPAVTLGPAPVPEAPLELIGVVTGQDAVAMIRSGAGEQFLHCGEMVQGYRVVRIGEDTVVLRQGHLGRVLRVGTAGSEAVALADTSKAPIATAQRSRRAIAAQPTPRIILLPSSSRSASSGAAISTSSGRLTEKQPDLFRVAAPPAVVAEIPPVVISVHAPVPAVPSLPQNVPAPISSPEVPAPAQPTIPENPIALPQEPTPPTTPAEIPAVLPVVSPGTGTRTSREK